MPSDWRKPIPSKPFVIFRKFPASLKRPPVSSAGKASSTFLNTTKTAYSIVISGNIPSSIRGTSLNRMQRRSLLFAMVIFFFTAFPPSRLFNKLSQPLSSWWDFRTAINRLNALPVDSMINASMTLHTPFVGSAS